MSYIGKMLQEIRGRESQGDFAKSLGVSNVTILNYEKGHRLPDIDFLVNVAKTQHVNLSELIDARIKDSPVSDVDMLPALPVLEEQAMQDLRIVEVMQRKLAEMKAPEASISPAVSAAIVKQPLESGGSVRVESLQPSAEWLFLATAAIQDAAWLPDSVKTDKKAQSVLVFRLFNFLVSQIGSADSRWQWLMDNPESLQHALHFVYDLEQMDSLPR